jgi:asparagine N-glycosylation enzyme membrane subunit Stt3
MNPLYYSLLHVFALFVLSAHTFMAFANPAPENRKRTMIITGSASLLALIAAGGLMAKLGYSWGSGWVIVKLICWLGLSGLAGIAYRRPHLRGTLALVALALTLTALVMVYIVRTM